MSGVLHGVLASLKAAAATATDTFFRYVTLLLNTSATNGAQNNTFLDSSTNAFSITRNGNTTQGTFSPFSQTGWSNYFDGTGDYLTTPLGQAPLQLSNSDFTFEAWVYRTGGAATQCITAGPSDYSTAAGSSWVFYVTTGATTSDLYVGSTSYSITSPNAPLNTWAHVAWVRTGGTYSTYLNGSRVATLGTLGTSTVNNGITNPVAIGGFANGSNQFTGYISNARLIKGSGGYDATQATITVPTSPLTAITNTSLLTCQSNRFIDNSTNNFTITRNGDVSVQAYSPFSPTAAWSASTNGGSGYFDGTGDYLSAASNAAFNILSGGDFTVECWFYANALTSNSGFGSTLVSRDESTSLNGFIFRVLPTALEWVYPGLVSNSQSFTFVTNTWYHVAAVRSSGAFRLYINGTQYSPTYTDRTADFASPVLVGASAYTINQAFFNGYISGVRIVKGTAVYTANFTPPTAPLTAITNTSLLLNFINAGIYDSASGNDLETVGNAQVSTTQAKWGTTSIYFDGTGDWLSIVDNKPDMRLGTAPFTIEAWVYPTTANLMCVVSVYDGINGWALRINANTIAWYSNGPGSLSGTASVPSNAWTHIAAVREGTGTNQFKIYVNGVLDVTATNASNFNQVAPCFVGAQGQSGGTAGTPWTGYIDDLRITNGYARYTANFTPPTAAFPLQ